jgi:hypothetical protein
MSDAGNGPPGPPDPYQPSWQTPPPPPPPGYGTPPPGYGPPPGTWGQPGYYAPTTDGKATAALILAIASFVFCPFIPAIVAIVLAGQAARTIAESGGRVQGAGMVTAARVISWINIVLCIVVVIVIFALGSITNTTFHNEQRCVTEQGFSYDC